MPCVCEHDNIPFSVLLSPLDGVFFFEEFLKSEFSEENILFWKACERYKTVAESSIKEEATVIYEEYISQSAAKLVSSAVCYFIYTNAHSYNKQRC